MNLVSELVLLRNRLLQLATESNERNLNAAVHGLNYVTSELRKNVMKTRMQPVSQLFDKLPRIVRDVSKDMGKKVRLETQGGETELDKSLLEAIKDPVTHILRNSIDHGIESPEKRKSQEKAEEGTVRVRAFHEGGNFHLEIADDGAGIDAERVKQKAIAKGLITAGSAEKMTESDVLNLIFLPGLSTAEKVTNVSGRGVGMDVVKTNIERIGGRSKLESVRAKGTTVWLEIPLTLATIPALTVVSGNSVFAIPQAALVETIALDVEDSPKYIDSIDGVSVFRFRGTVLPLISLREELKLKAKPAADGSVVKLVIVRTEARQVALCVDAIRNTEEIVIKPLDKRFKSIALYSGAAVLGDGRVALILDVPAFVRRAGVIAEKEMQSKQREEQRQREKLSLLLLGGSDGERMAVPLEYVQRLEEFTASAKEPMGELAVMQYRGEILPIVHLEALLDERRHAKRTEEEEHGSADKEKISAIVVRLGESRNMILEVPRILGITKVEIEKLTPPSRAGVRGSLVIQERVTELLDLPALLAKSPSLEDRARALIGAGKEPIVDSVPLNKETRRLCAELRNEDYPLALDNFAWDGKLEEFLDITDYVKVDFRKTGTAARNSVVKRLAGRVIGLIAEKIETREEFESAKTAGYTLFQGDFLTKPELLKRRGIPRSQAQHARLLALATDENLKFDKVEEAIKQDAALCYKLLRYLNSAIFHFPSRVASIRQALTLMGEVEVRRWIAVAAAGALGEGRPSELTRTALVRAYFSEELCKRIGAGIRANDGFLRGLLSIMDVILGVPAEEMFKELRMSETVRKWLTDQPYLSYELYDALSAFEQGNWMALTRQAADLQLDEDVVSEVYLWALQRADEILSAA